MKGQLIFGLLLVGAHFGFSVPNENQRIIDGRCAVAKQFPYQVAYDALNLSNLTQKSFEWELYCGGTLISKRIILTAAHCFQFPNMYAIKIYFGAVDKSNESEIGQQQLVVKLANVVVHEEYDNDNMFNDIALIKLPVDVAFDEYIRPAKLPEPGIIYSSEAIASGWGANKVDGEKIYDSKLRYSHVQILSHAECKKRLQVDFFESSRICVAQTKNSPCNGDSGGPVAVKHNGDTVLLGITSSSFDENCRDQYPDTSTRVASYLNWIHKNAGAHNLEV